jgi:hypothetical protein
MNYKLPIIVLVVIAFRGCDIYEYECESNTNKCSKNRVMSCYYHDMGSYWTEELDCNVTQTECMEYAVEDDRIWAACIVPNTDCELDDNRFCFNDRDLGSCKQLGAQDNFVVVVPCRSLEGRYCLEIGDGDSACGFANETP